MISRCPAWPLHLGDRLIVYHLARELSARGHQIDLIAYAQRPSDWSLSEQQPYTRFFHDVTLFSEPRRPAPEVLRRAVFPMARFPQKAEHAFASEVWREIERRVASTDYDFAHLFGGVQVYEFFGALGDLPAIITPYESYSLFLARLISHLTTDKAPAHKVVLARLQRVLASNFERWMFEPYRHTVVVSEADRDELLDINATLPVSVIPNGVDIPATRTTEREKNRILFLGNYEYAPNVDAAMWLAREIFPRIREQIADAKLWLVGNAPPPELRALASDHIEVTGRVVEVRSYFERATVFLCPLRIGAGIKNKVLEALAHGCPVIATPLSVDGIAVAHNRSALITSDATSLAVETVRLFKTPALQTELSTAGRALVEKSYSWGSVVDRYEALYHTLR